MNLSGIIALILRSLLIGGVSYYATSTIPLNPLSTRTKVVVSVVIVTVLIILDFLSSIFSVIRKLLCKTCPCNANVQSLVERADKVVSTAPPATVTPQSVDPDLDAAIRALQEHHTKMSSEAEPFNVW